MGIVYEYGAISDAGQSIMILKSVSPLFKRKKMQSPFLDLNVLSLALIFNIIVVLHLCFTQSSPYPPIERNSHSTRCPTPLDCAQKEVHPLLLA